MTREAAHAFVVCWPWHLWFLAPNDGHPRGGECSGCGRSVAVPRAAVGDPLCLYCGIDQGVVEAIDAPFEVAV